MVSSPGTAVQLFSPRWQANSLNSGFPEPINPVFFWTSAKYSTLVVLVA
jgi:hypothetical protein